MPFEFEVESLDSIEEPLRAAYVEREGKHYFDPDKYVDLKSAGLKKNNGDLKKEKDKLKGEFDSFKKKFADWSDDDLAAFNDWREKQNGGEGDGDGKKPEDLRKHYRDELKAEKAKWQAEKAAELAAKDKESAEWRDRYRKEKLTNRLTAWAAKSDVFDEEIETYVDFLIYKGHFGLTEDDEIAYYDKPGDEPSAIPPEKAIAEQLKERYGRFYRSQERGGSGSQGGAAGKTGGVDWRKLPPEERIAYGRKQHKARA